MFEDSLPRLKCVFEASPNLRKLSIISEREILADEVKFLDELRQQGLEIEGVAAFGPAA